MSIFSSSQKYIDLAAAQASLTCSHTVATATAAAAASAAAAAAVTTAGPVAAGAAT